MRDNSERLLQLETESATRAPGEPRAPRPASGRDLFCPNGGPVGWAARTRTAVGPSVFDTSLALTDQFVVSGTNFATTVILGRACGADNLGAYALAMTVVSLILCTQESLVLTPYTVFCRRFDGQDRAQFAGSVLLHHTLLAGATAVVLALVAASVAVLPGWGNVTGLAAMLALVVPFALLRDFIRRLAFAHLRLPTALVLDTVVAVFQIGGLVLLATLGALTAWSAFAALGLGCAISSAGWFWLTRPPFQFRRSRLRRDMLSNWRFGRWVFAALMTLMLQTSVVPWLLALTHGAEATGLYAACLTVVMLANPIILGVSNSLVPRAAQAFAEGGRTSLRRVVGVATLLMGLTMIPFCAGVTLWGEWLVQTVYGLGYARGGMVISTLALVMFVRAIGMTAYNGLRVMEHPQVNFQANLAGLVSTVATSCLLLPEFGVAGAAMGLLAGDCAGALIRWAVFLRVSRIPCSRMATA
jgi:O-antigen/teichoic acid export membrane protein